MIVSLYSLNSYLNLEFGKSGGFGTIYKAIWLKNNRNGEDEEDDDEEDEEVILKCHKNLNEDLNEFLKEWEYHTSVLSSEDIIEFYGFTEDPNTSKYMVVMYYANKDLMKKCWNEDPLKRPSSKEVFEIIEKWNFLPYKVKVEDINEELKSNIMEFINAPIGHKNLATRSHPKACFKSRLLDFTSKKLNEILESEKAYHASHSELNDCLIRDSRSLDESTSKKLNEIPESEDSQASGLGLLDIKADKN
ncbi:kinase-like domain-containing protein [Rhizophagus irregularis DAOM 181602=DAOM 197198]|nr:kinase-like domain-containing protein [Rhizophagus irregularis DAOM 181602=DAOM 197198]